MADAELFQIVIALIERCKTFFDFFYLLFIKCGNGEALNMLPYFIERIL